MTQYQPKIGDKVRVTVEYDLLGDNLDLAEVYTVTDLDEFDGTVWLGSYNVYPSRLQPVDADTPANTVISLWKRGAHLATADRSQCWSQIIDWIQQMNTAIEQLEREVNNG